MGVVVPERCDGDFEMVSCCLARFDLVSALFDLCVGGEAPSNPFWCCSWPQVVPHGECGRHGGGGRGGERGGGT